MHKVNLKIAGASLAIIAGLSSAGYLYWNLDNENTQLQERVTNLDQRLASTTADLEKSRSDNMVLSQVLKTEQDKNNIFQAKINEVATIVGTLEKLSKTDEELLKKYSKIYFLSENYIPSQLSSIDPQYLYEKNRPQLIHSGASEKLQALLGAAEQAGNKVQIISAYRSFYEQEVLKYGYTVVYGTGANQFSADQGYSEHQLGTAVDFTTIELKSNFTAFEQSPAFRWLNDNAYKYGFILSYPKGNAFYKFEPWHWRYVGVALATYLHDQSKRFYELDQREIAGYLITIFN